MTALIVILWGVAMFVILTSPQKYLEEIFKDWEEIHKDSENEK